MKKLILLLIIAVGCSTPEQCTCKGEFHFTYDPAPVFTVDNVDCQTGEPFLSENKNVVEYVGCE